MSSTEIPELLRCIVPEVGQVWEWEPTLAHAHARCSVVEVKWNGEAVWILSESTNGRYWNELDRWVEATVLIGTDDEPAPPQTEIERLAAALHARLAHPDFEYATTKNGRKDGMNAPPANSSGWEVNTDYHGGFERFDYHEENYWRRVTSRRAASGVIESAQPRDIGPE